MWALLPVAQHLLLETISRKSRQDFHINMTGIGLMIFSALAALFGVTFLFLALQSYLAEIYGESLSWLITAAVSFVLMALTHVVGKFLKHRDGLLKKVKQEIKLNPPSPFKEIMDDMVTSIKDHPMAAIALAGVAGLMAGEKISDRAKVAEAEEKNDSLWNRLLSEKLFK